MEYYDKISSGYDELYLEEQLEKLRIIRDHLRVQEPLLDIGAGTGISTSFFGVDAVALDPSSGMLEGYGGKKVVASAEDIPFPDGFFGTVISVTALHHVPDINKVISEIRRVSKPGATYAFSILKRAARFGEIVSALKSGFRLKEIESKKDLILVSY